jgi:FkbM family methyltransferase
MRFYRAVIIAVVTCFLIMSLAVFVRLTKSRVGAGIIVVHQAQADTRTVAPALLTPTSPPPPSPACRLKSLLSTEFSRSHSLLAGDASCSAPLVQQDNQELHPTVASVCSSSFGSSWKLLKHPLNIEYVASSPQETVVSNVFFPIAATCRDAAPGLVVDMGTNEGMFAMAAASLGCTVVTFDPQSMCIDILKRSLLGFKENEGFEKRMYALNAAASRTPSTIEASIDSCHGCYMTDGSVSCGSSGKEAGHWKRKQKIDSVDVAAVVQAIGVKEILLLHVDTEGHEVSVLRGLEAMLASKSIKNLIIEVQPVYWDSGDDKWIRNALQLAGYKCWQLHNLYNLHLPAIHIDTPKPSIDLSLPIPACDMFCSISYSDLNFFQSNLGLGVNTKKDIISCHDTLL